MTEHERFMKRCLELAALGAGSVSPNPMVGALIVCDNRIIGEGYHQAFGDHHAEANAIRNVTEKYADADELLKRSTLYVSLEPCSHFGKTPPCADLIVHHNIPRVVIATRDPFPSVNGKGIERLRQFGIAVVEDVLRDESLRLNKRFVTRVQKHRPYIILKWAQTGDGFFAPADGSQRWISGTEAKQLVHAWRSVEDAVLVGKNTVLTDNPELNVRLLPGRDPVRMIIDRNLDLPHDLKIFDQTQDTIIFNAVKTDIDGRIKYLELENFDTLLPQMMCYQMYLMDVQSVIVEGGVRLLTSFIDAGLWDEARIFSAPVLWGDGIKAPVLTGELESEMSVGADMLQTWYNQ